MTGYVKSVDNLLNKRRMKKMQDGREARLTSSGRYYVRHWGYTIMYYTLKGERIPLARARCEDCKELLISKRCGHFVQCSCGASFVDTDRWVPESHRYGGQVKQVTQSHARF